VSRLFAVHTEASLGWGGQEIRVLSEMAGMIGRGHRMLLMCPPEARIFGEAGMRGIPVEALPLGRKTWVGMRALRQRLKQLQPDLIVTHSSTDSWLTAMATRFWHGHPSTIRIRHISAPVSKTATTRWLYGRAADHVVTTGERLRQDLIRDLRLASTHVSSVPTGIDLARYASRDKGSARRQLGLPEAGFFVGIIATLRSWKGHRYLLDAWAGLPVDAGRLLVVGDGPGRDNLRRQAADLGIAERVVMPGNQSDVAPWLAALDVFALPSYANEGVPQAIMQAMACGLPVVSTPVGSIPEIVADGETGLLVPPRDTEALRAALARLAGDPALCRRLGEAGAAHAREHFADTLMLDRMEAIFRQVLDGGHP
jgi:glycosyltransferase involved in cell wall biosynthesis